MYQGKPVVWGTNYSGGRGYITPAKYSNNPGTPESGYGTPGFDWETQSGGTPWKFVLHKPKAKPETSPMPKDDDVKIASGGGGTSPFDEPASDATPGLGAGGGGSLAANGGNGSAPGGGDGADVAPFAIMGSSPGAPGFGTPGPSPGRYFGGGGGGGGEVFVGTSSGGAGGGGNSGKPAGVAASPANTGGGGGGGNVGGSGNGGGGNGAPGIVMIRYKFQ